MDKKKLFDTAFRAVACTPNQNQSPEARSTISHAAAELREIESGTEIDVPAEVIKKVTELVDLILKEKDVGAEERDRYLNGLSEAWE